LPDARATAGRPRRAAARVLLSAAAGVRLAAGAGRRDALETGLDWEERVQLTLGRLRSAEPGLGEPRRPPLVMDDRRAGRQQIGPGAAAVDARFPAGQDLGARDDAVEG